MIEIKSLSHSLGNKLVLQDINLAVPDSSILGIVGINGAGKSTLLRLLAGVYVADEGRILYDGNSPEKAPTRQNIFFLPDDPYYTTFTTPNKLFEFYKTFYPHIDRSVFDSLLSEYQIKTSDFVRNFSKGMRRQIFIALALAVKPKILLMDEPTSALDPISTSKIEDLATELKEKYKAAPVSNQVIQIDGISYTVVSHYAGDKDINKVVRNIALSKAYEDMKIHSA